MNASGLDPFKNHFKSAANCSVAIYQYFRPISRKSCNFETILSIWRHHSVRKRFSGGHPAMQKAKYFPAGNFKMPKRPGDLSRLTDHLVARLRAVQITLADHQPEHEPEKQAGS